MVRAKERKALGRGSSRYKIPKNKTSNVRISTTQVGLEPESDFFGVEGALITCAGMGVADGVATTVAVGTNVVIVDTGDGMTTVVGVAVDGMGARMGILICPLSLAQLPYTSQAVISAQ